MGGATAPTGAARTYLSRIERLNPTLNAFITVLSKPAMEGAAKSDERHSAGAAIGPLDGIPLAVKDIIYIAGVKCTAGSRILANNVASYDAPVVRKLKDAGAVLVGTTNLHEFAAGVTSNNPHFGPVRNPWDRRRIAGGSSGGSAAAVASSMSPVALGTDTAGSVRIPAALCGVLGFKPTYGRVSRLGVVPLAPSLDTVGVLAASAWDAAAVLQTISGHEEGDPTTVDTPVPDYLKALESPFGTARVGVPWKALGSILDAGVESAFREFLVGLQTLGFKVEGIDLGGWDDASANWLPIRRAEATAFHLQWLESTPELYGDDVRKLLEQGRDVRAVDYVRAVNSRPSLMHGFATAMADFDFVATPTTCAPAPSIGDETVPIAGKNVEVYRAMNRITLPFNMVGFPAVSIPMGLTEGLPVGAQLASKPFEEANLLRLANAIEASFPRPLP